MDTPKQKHLKFWVHFCFIQITIKYLISLKKEFDLKFLKVILANLKKNTNINIV